MKIQLTMTALLLSSGISFGQKCKYDFERKDPLTGNTQKVNSTKLARSGAAEMQIAFQSEEKKFLLGLYIKLQGPNGNYIEQGDTLSFALENGSSLLLRSIDKYLPNAQVLGTATSTYYTPMYAITEGELKNLSTLKITAVKLKIGAQPLIAEISDRNNDKVKKAAACILQ